MTKGKIIPLVLQDRTVIDTISELSEMREEISEIVTFVRFKSDPDVVSIMYSGLESPFWWFGAIHSLLNKFVMDEE